MCFLPAVHVSLEKAPDGSPWSSVSLYPRLIFTEQLKNYRRSEAECALRKLPSTRMLLPTPPHCLPKEASPWTKTNWMLGRSPLKPYIFVNDGSNQATSLKKSFSFRNESTIFISKSGMRQGWLSAFIDERLSPNDIDLFRKASMFCIRNKNAFEHVS